MLSTTMHLPGSAPWAKISRLIATLAAPAPMKAIFTSPISRPTTLRAFTRPASVTHAVPCWSSCHTGISHSSRNVSRMRKHLGWAMSSRFTPPNPGCTSLTNSMNLSGSLVSTMSGKLSTPPRYLYSRLLPSITGRPALGPMSPMPNTRVPSLITATVLPLLVCS